MVFMCGYMFLSFLAAINTVHQKSIVAYSAFLIMIKKRQIAEVLIGEGMKTAKFKTTADALGSVNLIPGQVDALQALMLKKNIVFSIAKSNMFMNFFGTLAPWILGYGISVMLFSGFQAAAMGGQNKSQFSKDVKSEMTGKKFSDVAGIDEAKNEL